jgi:hypothetical protein
VTIVGARSARAGAIDTMKRILVVAQAGAFGHAACAAVAERLGRRLGLPVLAARRGALDAVPPATDAGWVAMSAVGALSSSLLRAADAAIWLHYSPLAVAREWLRGQQRLGESPARAAKPRLADLCDSLLHMALTPHVHRLLHQAASARVHIFHLRNPAETEFWLYAQEHRLAPPAAASALPA